MEIILIAACLLITAFFVLAEMALVSANRRRLAKMAERGDKGAKVALALLADPSKFLSTVQVGMTFGSIVAAIYGGTPLTNRLTPILEQLPWTWGAAHAHALAGGIVSFFIGALTVIFAEIVPKRLALIKPEGLAANFSRPMAFVAAISSPLVNAMSTCADVVMFIFGKKRAPEDTMSEDELRMMVDQGMASGVLHASEHRMVHGALSLDLITAEQLMTPSNRVVWLNLDDTEEVNWRKVVASGHTWFPVFKGTTDRHLGVISVKRLWANLALTGSASIKDLLTESPTIPQQSTGTQLLERFRKDKIHLALVTDEFGRVRGVVSLNDVLESVVGELPNEGSPVTQTKPVRRRDDGSWVVDAVVSLEDFREATGIIGRFPGEGSGRFTAISGFIMRSLGRIPNEGDRVEALGHIFEVIDMDGHRLDKVLVMPKATPVPA
ncbi:MAG: hemolysin family protein [Verrucomicrobia bacterium]|nr:hemolysin family protein [Verrucomicrobiota bacterium]